MRFGGVAALCREDANGNSLDPAGIDVSRLVGTAVVFDGRTSDGKERPHLGVVNKVLVIPMEACPGVLEHPVIGPAEDITDMVVYVEWETGGSKSALALEALTDQQLGTMSMGCNGRIVGSNGAGMHDNIVIEQIVVQPTEVAADRLQVLWRLKE